GLDLNQEGETLTDSSEYRPWGSPDLSAPLSLCQFHMVEAFSQNSVTLTGKKQILSFEINKKRCQGMPHDLFKIIEEVAVAVEVPATSIPGEPMDIMTALQLVLRKSLAYGGLARGLHEGAKVIEKHAAQLCVLAEDCDQPDYVKLVKALCAEHNVSLLTVPSAKTLGEWAGLCKIDSEGKARKVTGCSCVVVKDFGEEHEAYNVVLQHVKAN
ncbi:40S ribosomal protein S12, partial [Glycine soja]